MKYVFDNIIFSKEKQGGISNYWYELIKTYRDNAEAFFYEEQFAGENIFRKKLELGNLIGHAQLPLFAARMLPIKYKSDADKLLYHSSFYRKLITNAEVCEIVTVHDFIHDYYSPLLKRRVHNYLKYGSIKRSSGIICISNNTYHDLKKFCPPGASQKVTVIYNGVSDEYTPLNKEQCKNGEFKDVVNDDYLLYVGSRANYKNFDFVARLMAELRGFHLVVVGGPLSDDEKAKIPSAVLSRIKIVQGITNEQLNVLYNCAYSLIYPSAYEGFGIPVVEAMKAGCPVIALNASSIPEIAGDAGILINDLNISEFLTAIKNLSEGSQRQQLIEAGIENAKRFNWDKCIGEVKDFYAEVSDKF